MRTADRGSLQARRRCHHAHAPTTCAGREAESLGKEKPKRYQVSFLATKAPAELVRRLESAVVAPERLTVVGREIYAWHPEGVARSKLWGLLAGRQLDVTATARNWTTVTKLLELAAE